MRGAVDGVKRVHLELGGKAPVIVFADADLGAMAHAVALGATYNTGQDCTAATRVYLERSVYDDGVAALRAELAGVVAGDPMDPETRHRPARLEGAPRRASTASSTRAVADGAEALVGGHAIDRLGSYYAPTLLVGAAQYSEIVQGEVFGPVLVVAAVRRRGRGRSRSRTTTPTASRRRCGPRMSSARCA